MAVETQAQHHHRHKVILVAAQTQPIRDQQAAAVALVRLVQLPYCPAVLQSVALAALV
jgi:hypothetical protein